MRKIFALFLLFPILYACKEEKATIVNPNLNGRWEFVRALRNGKETKTLNSGYFAFNEADNSIESNIFQLAEKKTYSIDGNTIKIKGKESYDLSIDKLQNDTMILKGNIWKFKMEFLLVKNDSIGQNLES